MRVLLDENLPRRLKDFLPPEAVVLTVQERGWGSIENGDLLGLAQEEFEVLLTIDRGIPHQQDLSRFDLAVVILEAKGNKISDLSPLMDSATEALRSARPGKVVSVTG